jgi:hypothetical protein
MNRRRLIKSVPAVVAAMLYPSPGSAGAAVPLTLNKHKGAYTPTDTATDWEFNQWAGGELVIFGERGELRRTIACNTANTLTFTRGVRL